MAKSHSPKNKFVAEISWSVQDGTWYSDASEGAMTLEEVERLAREKFENLKATHPVDTPVRVHVRIRENLAVWPAFDWKTVKAYDLGTHGGAREGAGRKPVENKRVQMIITVAPETKARLEAAAEKNRDRVGRLVDALVDGYLND